MSLPLSFRFPPSPSNWNADVMTGTRVTFLDHGDEPFSLAVAVFGHVRTSWDQAALLALRHISPGLTREHTFSIPAFLSYKRKLV